jgi:hypothetical protein
MDALPESQECNSREQREAGVLPSGLHRIFGHLQFDLIHEGRS